MAALELHARTRGAGDPLLLLHGFTSGARAWDASAAVLAASFRVVAPDLLGHGESPAPPDPARYAMRHCVADLIALLDRMGIRRAHCLGYSMGGRVALALARAQPRRLRSLVLESASPGIEDAGERRARRRRDAALAARLERDGVAAFVAHWMDQPLFATQRSLPPALQAAARQLRLRNSAPGLANSLRGLGSGAQASYWDDLAHLQIPTLLINGEHDEKFCAIGARMAPRIPASRRVVIPGAGHTTHLERPAEFLRAVTSFLEEIGTSSPQSPGPRAGT